MPIAKHHWKRLGDNVIPVCDICRQPINAAEKDLETCSPFKTPEPEKEQVIETKRLYRRKALLVEAFESQGMWFVQEAGREITVDPEVFPLLYESLDLEREQPGVGLPDMEPGTTMDKDGVTFVRVQVISGKGSVAYWDRLQPDGEKAKFRVLADLSDNLEASHRAGRFSEPFEGRSGDKAWVVLK